MTGLVLPARAVYNVNYNTDFHKLTIVLPSTEITTGCTAILGNWADSKIQSMDLEDKEIGGERGKRNLLSFTSVTFLPPPLR